LDEQPSLLALDGLDEILAHDLKRKKSERVGESKKRDAYVCGSPWIPMLG
jgi:hypothetical protein